MFGVLSFLTLRFNIPLSSLLHFCNLGLPWICLTVPLCLLASLSMALTLLLTSVSQIGISRTIERALFSRLEDFPKVSSKEPHKLREPLNVDLRRTLDWHRRARPAPQEAAEGCEASGGQVHGHDALLLSHPCSLLLTEQCRHSGRARHDAWSEHIRTKLSRQPPPELRRARSRRHVTDWPRP